MIQNFNQRNYFSQYRAKSELELKLDSQNRLYRISYGYFGELEVYLEFIAELICDKKFDEIEYQLAETVYTGLTKTQLSYSSVLMDKALAIFLIHMRELKGFTLNPEEDKRYILCACLGLDRETFSQMFKETRGDKKELLKLSKMGMSCDSCENLFETEFKRNMGTSEFFLGMERDEARVKIQQLLMDFSDYTHLDLSSVNIFLVKAKANHITFEYELDENKTSLSDLKNALSNFYSAKLGSNIEVTLTAVE